MLDEAQLRVLAGGVQVTSTSYAALDGTKGGWPDPPRTTHTTGAAALAIRVAFGGAGHGPCSSVPALRVTYATAGAL
jgi:hypothetical protein